MKITLIEVGKRLKKFLDSKELGVNQFGRMTNTSGAQISNIIAGKNYGLNKLVAIGEACPDLNLVWLLTGKEQMLLQSEIATTNEPEFDGNSLQDKIQALEEREKYLENKLVKLKLQNENLKGAIDYQNITIETLKNTLSIVSASNQDLRELIGHYKSIHNISDSA